MAGFAPFSTFKIFAAQDGERFSVVEFENWETHDAWAHGAWAHDLRHRIAQKLGREKFYHEYSIRVGKVARQHDF